MRLIERFQVLTHAEKLRWTFLINTARNKNKKEDIGYGDNSRCAKTEPDEKNRADLSVAFGSPALSYLFPARVRLINFRGDDVTNTFVVYIVHISFRSETIHAGTEIRLYTRKYHNNNRRIKIKIRHTDQNKDWRFWVWVWNRKVFKNVVWSVGALESGNEKFLNAVKLMQTKLCALNASEIQFANQPVVNEPVLPFLNRNKNLQEDWHRNANSKIAE